MKISLWPWEQRSGRYQSIWNSKYSLNGANRLQPGPGTSSQRSYQRYNWAANRAAQGTTGAAWFRSSGSPGASHTFCAGAPFRQGYGFLLRLLCLLGPPSCTHTNQLNCKPAPTLHSAQIENALAGLQGLEMPIHTGEPGMGQGQGQPLSPPLVASAGTSQPCCLKTKVGRKPIPSWVQCKSLSYSSFAFWEGRRGFSHQFHLFFFFF